MVNTGKKKYQYTQTNNGKTYFNYRKSLTTNGKTKTVRAADAKERVGKNEEAVIKTDS